MALWGLVERAGRSLGWSNVPLKLRCLLGEYCCGVYLLISSLTSTDELMPSLVPGREASSRALAVEAYCAHIGVTAG